MKCDFIFILNTYVLVLKFAYITNVPKKKKSVSSKDTF